MYQNGIGVSEEIQFSLVSSGNSYFYEDEQKLYVYQDFSQSIDVWDFKAQTVNTFVALSMISCNDPLAAFISVYNPVEYYFVDSDLSLPSLDVYGCNVLVTFSSFDLTTGQWASYKLNSECTQENEEGSRQVAIEVIAPGLHFIRISRYSPDGNIGDYEINLDCGENQQYIQQQIQHFMKVKL